MQKRSVKSPEYLFFHSLLDTHHYTDKAPHMTSQSARLHTVGQLYHDFRLTKVLPIPELQCTLKELIHEPSGALVMHIENDDPENLFCLSFQTLPDQSNGVAHILEHTVLCGSKNFQLRIPFLR